MANLLMDLTIFVLVPGLNGTLHWIRLLKGQPVLNLHEDGFAVLVKLVLWDVRFKFFLLLLGRLVRITYRPNLFSFLALFFTYGRLRKPAVFLFFRLIGVRLITRRAEVGCLNIAFRLPQGRL